MESTYRRGREKYISKQTNKSKNYKFVLGVINETSKKLRKRITRETYETRPL